MCQDMIAFAILFKHHLMHIIESLTGEKPVHYQG